jgi:uncharacterized membrane protein
MLEAVPQSARFDVPILAAIPGAGELLTIFVWSVVATIAVLGGLYLARAVRRWTQREERVGGFALQDLRDMRARGEINDQEFAAMRAALLAEMQPAAKAESAQAADAAPEDRAEPQTGDAPPPDDPASPT